MSDRRQKKQLALAFPGESRSEAPMAVEEGTESLAAKHRTESPAITEPLMEEVCERENCKQALRRVRANKGSPGVNGMSVHKLAGHLKQHWPAIREQLLSGSYKPQPVKGVEIPKPDGGVRKLGIPTVLDRFIQQAVMQVLQRRWDRTFSEHSYGFRPQRSAHQAVQAAQQHIADGYRWVLDLDLEKCFGSISHEWMGKFIEHRIADRRILRLIRKWLRAGVSEEGSRAKTDVGTPQGAVASPLLANVYLHYVFDLWAQHWRKHRATGDVIVVRYADDSVPRARMAARPSSAQLLN
jgi:RNA-directed DNA polymerase